MRELVADENCWKITRAKARFSDVVKRAELTPQLITKYGKPRAIVVSAKASQRNTEPCGSLAEFLMASPLRGTDLDIERLR